jgi:hypothetical protein
VVVYKSTSLYVGLDLHRMVPPKRSMLNRIAGSGLLQGAMLMPEEAAGRMVCGAWVRGAHPGNRKEALKGAARPCEDRVKDRR